MNSSFKLEDASEGSPFGYDTTILQDYPIEVKASERLRKSSKSKRFFESRLLVDPYLLSRQQENGELSGTIRKLFIEPYTLIFTSEDYDSDEANDIETNVAVTSTEKIVDKIENRIKTSPLGVNHSEKAYEPPNKKKKIVSRESSDMFIPNELPKSPNAVPQSTPQPARPPIETKVTPSAEKIANTVAKDIAARMGQQIAAGAIQGTNSQTPKPAVSASPTTPQQNKITASPATAVVGQPGTGATPHIQNNAQKVQVRLSDGRILLMSRDLYLKLRESGPANNASLTPVEQKPVNQQSKPVAANSAPMSTVATPSGSAVRPNCVLRLPNSQAVNGTLDNLLTFMRESNLGNTAQKQNAPGPRFIIQHRPVANNVKQIMAPVASASSSSQIKIVAAQGGSNPRIIINPGSNLSEQLSKIQQQQSKSNPAGPTSGPAMQQPFRIVTTQRVVPRQAIVVPNSGPMVQQRPTSYFVTNRVGQGQLRLPMSAQNQPVRLCLMPAPRNTPGASQTQNFVVMNSPGNIRQVNYNNLVKINSVQNAPVVSGQSSTSTNLTQSAGTVVIQRPQNLILINGQQQQQFIPKTNLLQITNKTT